MKEESYNVGIERESLRCNEEGKVSDLPHPKVFGENNDFITTDWSESQIEIRTPVCKNTEECYEKLENITDVVLNEIGKRKELLWPYSMPCILPTDDKFTFQSSSEGQYKRKLLGKYSSKMLCISGIHVNFSINKKFYEKIRKINNKIPKNLDDAYLKIMKTFIDKVWILMCLFGATPLQNTGDNYKCTYSIRNSYKEGFKNKNLLPINFQNKEKYLESIKKNIAVDNISSIRELYTPIRAKGIDKSSIEELKNNEINRVEVRICDLNPFDKCAISKVQLDFIIAFLFYCLIDEDDFSLDYRTVAESGIAEKYKSRILDEIEKINKTNDELGLEFEKSIKQVKDEYKANINLSEEISKIIIEKGYIPSMIELAKKYSEDANKCKYCIKKGNKKIVSATAAIIKDAITKGINYNIINLRDYDTFVEFSHKGHKEYVIGGTRTNKDNYILPYITDDKYLAKQLMSQNGIIVPNGIMINKKMTNEEIDKQCALFYDKPVVVKPRTTNGGTGITVFSKPAQKEELIEAIKFAFNYDDNILLEECVKGKEYRFIVINGKCISVVLRRSASVIGNGKDNVQELIERKDKEPWHYLLRNRMKIDEPLQLFLKQQGLDLNYIPRENERVYLRENSNCSTGGESVNVTDIIPTRFKKIAENATNIFGAKVCGVDIIIEDFEKNDYAIIEINDDPGYDISEWPYEGEETHIGLEILKMLDLA